MAIDRKYSKLIFEQILEDYGKILKAKQGAIADFGNSSYGRTIMELLSAHADMNAFWIESAFRDSMMVTAENVPAVYANARSLGYSIRRPIPARAGFGISLKRTGSKSNLKVIIPKNTVFSVSGRNLLCIDDVEFIWDRNEPDSDNGLLKLSSGRAVLVEGTIRNQQFFSNGNKFLEFNLVDTSFSDWFGPGDPNYIEPDAMIDRLGRFTVISSDSGLTDGTQVTQDGYEDKIFWKVSRRGLHDPFLENPLSQNEDLLTLENKTNNYTVLVETANDGSVNISFGDGVISAIPFGIINVQYLSTQGEDGNLLNVAGNQLSTQSSAIQLTQLNGQETDLTLADLNIALTTDIRGGLNIESVDSISKNSSKIFSTLDSLHNRNSYLLYLSRLSDVKYANAFGEDLISKVKNNKFNIKYSNVVRYTLLKDLYREKDGKYYVTDPYEYYVSGYKVEGLMYTWEYDYADLPTNTDVKKLNIDINQLQKNIDDNNLAIIQLPQGTTLANTPLQDIIDNEITSEEFISEYVPYTINSGLVPGSIFNAHLEPTDFIVTGSELEYINDSLNRRGYVTLAKNHVYVPPTVHDLSMDIELILFEGTVFTDIKNKIIQSIYAYLKENTYFASPIYKSKIECIIQSLPEVAGVNLTFTPRTNKYTGLNLNELLWLSPAASQFIRQDSQILNINDTEMTFLFDYNRISENGEVISTDSNSSVIINLQNMKDNVQTKIRDYYILKLSTKDSDGEYIPRTNVTEEDLIKFSSYIWVICMNEIYTELNKKYTTAKNNGNFIEANKLYELIESLRGWYFNNGNISFKDTDSITNLRENTTALYKFITYNLEYIKLVRDIFASIVSSKLIDGDGNITRYSNENEIVQFLVDTSNISIKIGRK